MVATYWHMLYNTMKRARTDIVATAAEVFGFKHSRYRLVDYAFPLKGPSVAGRPVEARQSLKDAGISVCDILNGLKGNLRKMPEVWKLFVEGCMSGKIRGVKKTSPCLNKYAEYIGTEAETLFRLELQQRFEIQGFQWQQGNDGVKNERYNLYKTMKLAVSSPMHHKFLPPTKARTTRSTLPHPRQSP